MELSPASFYTGILALEKCGVAQLIEDGTMMLLDAMYVQVNGLRVGLTWAYGRQ